MKQASILLALVFLALELGQVVAGPETALLVIYGALALMALMIAATFLWLYVERATPLALGMAYSWLGAGLFAGWWWGTNLAGQPGWAPPIEAALAVLAFAVVGAMLHFAVIQRSFGFRGASFLWPLGLAFALSGLVSVLR